ncbi:MAG: chemotaxis protein CheW [Alphaproteobacteria bacterium]|nr:chemotaxis protein CheW [Alphaproteobacteria bacterium]
MADSFDKTREAVKEVAAQKGMAQQFLTFTVDGEEFGVDIMTVREIKGWTETTRLPNSQEFMRGVMNLRGLIIPIFDLRTRFKRGLTEATPKHVVIILAVGARNIGILVDTVSDILDAGADQIKPAPTSDSPVDSAFISGLISLEERMVVLLDVEHLFDTKHIETALATAA